MVIETTVSVEESEKRGMIVHHVTVSVPSTRLFELLKALADLGLTEK